MTNVNNGARIRRQQALPDAESPRPSHLAQGSCRLLRGRPELSTPLQLVVTLANHQLSQSMTWARDIQPDCLFRFRGRNLLSNRLRTPWGQSSELRYRERADLILASCQASYAL